jgi:Holliday junction resolvase RusA-like endonuclease
VLDALQDAGLFNDDFQIDELTIRRGSPVEGGRLFVKIEEVE